MTKKNARYEKQNYVFLFLILFGLIFVRYCYYGFEYYYQLDDYIQYHNYTAYGGGFLSLVKNLGLLSSRPLAGICDVFIWSRLYGHMLAAVAIISAMYAASAVFFHKVFSKQFGTGYLFFVIYALMPLGFEGSYWVSASSRIVAGLFFASLAFYFFDAWCDEGRKKDLVFFAVLQLAAFCLYEQLVLFSGALTILVMLRSIKTAGRGRARWGFLMFANAAIYLGVTKLMPAGVYSARAQLYLPWQEGYFEHCFLSAGKQIETVFVNGTAATLGRGLLRGFKFLVTEPSVFYVLVILSLCYVLFVYLKDTNRESIRFFAELIAGLLLVIAPLLLFFILKGPWFGLRNAVLSFCGIALIFDALFDLIFGKLKNGRLSEAIAVSALALLFCIASVSELHDYRETTAADTRIAEAAAEAIESVSFNENDSIWLLNVDASYVEDGNFYYHEHDYGVTSSDWALTGAIRAVSGKGDLPYISPVSVYAAFTADESEITKARAFCYINERVEPVTIGKSADNLWLVTDSSGKTLGTMSYIGGGLWLKMN